MEEGLMSFGGLEEQFSHFSEAAFDEKIPFLQMLQCIHQPAFRTAEQSPILQIRNLEPESCDPRETLKKRDDKAAIMVKEKRKRKRTRAPKNQDEVDRQRMTHIAVERNRRRLMNVHLNSLRSLMPPSYHQRVDQASVVGGAIDYIKELEQHLQSLEAAKQNELGTNETPEKGPSSYSRVFTSNSSVTTTSEDGLTARFGGGETAEVEATVIQNHVSLKVRCKKGKGQILKAIVSLEQLKLAILHLTISSSADYVFYSFNLKIEDGCKVGAADEIVTAVHQIFEHINGEIVV